MAAFGSLPTTQACSVLRGRFSVEKRCLFARIEKVISAKKTALWYQIDRRIDLLINLQLSSRIPMVDTSK